MHSHTQPAMPILPPGLSPGDRVCVLGLGRSGLAATALLLRLGCRVRALERAPSSDLEAAWKPYADAGAECVIGEHPAGALAGCRLLVRSPGVPGGAPILAQARAAGIPVRSELELGASQLRTPWIAITGTNGKSTTTAWTAHLLRRAGVLARAAGNIGHALARAVLEEPAGTIFVVEVSSFQLEDSPGLHPQAAAILNITPDHLDRHGTLEAYAAAKWSLAANQGPDDLLVLGPGLSLPEAGAYRMRIRRCELDPQVPGAMVAVRDGRLVWKRQAGGAADDDLLPVDQIALPGPHNLINAMVALSLASAVVADIGRLIPGLRDFPGLAHRLERVGCIGEVVMVNDSKSTNVDSLRVALQSYAEPVVLVAGGRDKQGRFEQLQDAARRRVKHLVAVGEAAGRIIAAWPMVSSERAASFEDALERAVRAAQPKGIVLLSPGCASFDMFKNFEERGDRFRAYVRARASAAAQAPAEPPREGRP